MDAIAFGAGQNETHLTVNSNQLGKVHKESVYAHVHQLVCTVCSAIKSVYSTWASLSMRQQGVSVRSSRTSL